MGWASGASCFISFLEQSLWPLRGIYHLWTCLPFLWMWENVLCLRFLAENSLLCSLRRRCWPSHTLQLKCCIFQPDFVHILPHSDKVILMVIRWLGRPGLWFIRAQMSQRGSRIHSTNKQTSYGYCHQRCSVIANVQMEFKT